MKRIRNGSNFIESEDFYLPLSIKCVTSNVQITSQMTLSYSGEPRKWTSLILPQKICAYKLMQYMSKLSELPEIMLLR